MNIYLYRVNWDIIIASINNKYGSATIELFLMWYISKVLGCILLRKIGLGEQLIDWSTNRDICVYLRYFR